VTLGGGIGFGMGYANCQHDFNSPYILHGTLKKVRHYSRKDLTKKFRFKNGVVNPFSTIAAFCFALHY